jgi:hypothetical protein
MGRNSIRAVARGLTGQINSPALVIADHPVAFQLRYLQTLLEIGDTNSTTIVFPAPIGLMRPFLISLGSGGR